jgi:UDP-3-O-[3-hydroxymyristoyl] glucosamine N-acyltransferase
MPLPFGVIIEDHVDIGAGCTINKGVSGDTVIGAGSKLDCQIHIGHGVVVGKNCLFAAQVGIGGKTVVEDNVVLYGQVGIAQALHIGKNAVVLAKSGVSKSLEGGKTYFGIPAEEVREKYKELAALRQLPELIRKLRSGGVEELRG